MLPKVRTETTRKSFNGSKRFNDISNELEDINRSQAFSFPSRCVIGSWGIMDFGKYSRGDSRTVSFLLEQSGSPLPPRGLIIPVTRHSIIFGLVMIVTVLGHHFSRLTYKFHEAWWLRVASWRRFSGCMV